MKKLISFLTILLIISTMFLAFANQTSGEYLQSIGIIDGDENGNLNEDQTLTRAEATKLIVSLNGDEENALMLDLSPSFSDAQNGWYTPYIGFAEYQDWVSGYPNGTFRPDNTLSSKEWTAMLMNVLGYPYTWSSVVEEANAIGLQVNAINPAAITRGESFDAIVDALNLNLYNSNETLIESLGLGGSGTNYDFKILNSKTNSLVQTTLHFNQPIDEYSATNIDHYSFEYSEPITIYDIDVSDDHKTVTLYHTAIANSSTVIFNANHIMNFEKDLMCEPYKELLTYYDKTAPVIESIDIVGEYKVYIRFSEPINNGRQIGYYGDDLSSSDPYNKYNITMDIQKIIFENNSNNLTFEDEYVLNENHQLLILTTNEKIDQSFTTIMIPEMIQDYENNYMPTYEESFHIKADKEAPVLLGYKEAYTTHVTLIYDEPIEFVHGSGSSPSALYENGSEDTPYYYHTNTSNSADSISALDNEVTIFFDSSSSMPMGTAYLNIAKNTFSDYWGNKMDVQVLPIKVTRDLQSTNVEYWTLENNNRQLIIEFDNYMYEESVIDTSNYQIYDTQNNNVTNLLLNDDSIKYETDFTNGKSRVILNFKSTIDKPYTLYIDTIQDTSRRNLTWTIKF